MSDKIKVAVLYRVIQEWRRPIFERLHEHPELSLTLYHGPDFTNSKVISTRQAVTFPAKKQWSFQLRKESKNGAILMPLSPFLFFTLLRDRPDVVVTEGASNLFNALIGFLYCKLFRKKFIWWSLGKLKGTVHTGLRKRLDVIIQYLERHSDAIISYSTFGKEYFVEIGVPPERVFVAVNVVDTTSKFEALAKIADYGFVEEIRKEASMLVLFVGAFTPQKRLEVLVRAFGKFSLTAPAARLILVGDGPEREKIEKIAGEYGDSHIELTGKIFAGVERYFLAADLFVLPGLGGLAVSEAMLYGLPVIASIGDGCEQDLIISGENGIIDEQLDEDRLLAYLLDLYHSPEKLRSFQLAATRTIREVHNLENYLAQVVAAIKS